MKQIDLPSMPNLLKERDPELVKELSAFRSRLGDLLLDKLDAVLDDPLFRDRGKFLPLEDLRPIAHILRILTKDSWTEEDLDLFDASWRDACRSDLFGDEFESSRHCIKIATESARMRLLEEQTGAEELTMRQPTLWERDR